MRTGLWIATLACPLLLTSGTAVPAEAARPDLGHTARLALAVLSGKHATLSVTSPAFRNGGEIPDDNTQYGKNIFPGLTWTGGPAGTRSYVVFIQGESYGDGPTTIQFTLFNVPAGTKTLKAGMTTPPAGAVYGPNVHGANKPYAGPHTHTGDRHGYHLEVFALDASLQLPPTANFDALMSAMAGHVLASGELVAYTAKPADAVYKPNGG
jgi:para-nitrobenzyl esterase